MNSEIINFFLNKVCTIFLNKINRKFNEEQNINYFVGKVLEINKDGILIEHIGNKCKSFFYTHSIIGIAEENFVYSDEKENLKTTQVKKEKVKNNLYDNIDNLTDVLDK
jgi:uncharacterized protein (DUF488 family)